MQPSVDIRPATTGDLWSCAELFCLHSGGNIPDRKHNLARDLHSAHRQLLVATLEAEVVGFGRVAQLSRAGGVPDDIAPDGVYLIGIVIAPALRRQGIGHRLTRARLSWAADHSTDVWYFTSVRNTASIALHARFGFTEVDRSSVLRGVSFPDQTGVLYRADISAHDQR